MSKKIQIGSKPVSKPLPISADNWVENRLGEPDVEATVPVSEPVAAKTEEISNRYSKTLDMLAKSEEKMKRLTIDIPEDLHKKIKSQCAMEGTTIAQEVRKFFLQKYGNL